mmetsp:Transcript_7928/g.14592  ORF Transcript_7928/g.14592 Transcript_7928/m.14592 type:complete len:84 (+) Transcript_7928:332-583(+)
MILAPSVPSPFSSISILLASSVHICIPLFFPNFSSRKTTHLIHQQSPMLESTLLAADTREVSLRRRQLIRPTLQNQALTERLP